jgi:hypothetical protein
VTIEQDGDGPKGRFSRIHFEYVIGALIIVVALYAYIRFSDWPLIYRGDSFHDRMMHRLDSIERNYPRSWKILELSRAKIDTLGYEILRFDPDSPLINDFNKAYMAKWPEIAGRVDGQGKQIVLRLSSLEQWLAALLIGEGEYLDHLLLHEMVHVAYDKEIETAGSMIDAEDQLKLCLDPNQSPKGWEMFERSLVDELVAYVAAKAIIDRKPARVPAGHDIVDPYYSWDRWYLEKLDYLIPECFSRVFHKSVVGWSPYFSEEEAEILRQRVEDFRNSKRLHGQVVEGLRKLRIKDIQ